MGGYKDSPEEKEFEALSRLSALVARAEAKKLQPRVEKLLKNLAENFGFKPKFAHDRMGVFIGRIESVTKTFFHDNLIVEDGCYVFSFPKEISKSIGKEKEKNLIATEETSNPSAIVIVEGNSFLYIYPQKGVKRELENILGTLEQKFQRFLNSGPRVLG